MGPRRCAGCKYLRRKCPPNCILSPYFPFNDPQRFACVHRVYGASNVIKMLQQLQSHDLRARAADSLYYEAQRRIEDPVYGSAGIITKLQQQIQDAETELAKTRAQIALNMNSVSIGTSNVSLQHSTQYHQQYYHDRHDDRLIGTESDDHLMINNLLEGQPSIDDQQIFSLRPFKY